MKLIMENWKKYLLTEAMKGVGDLQALAGQKWPMEKALYNLPKENRQRVIDAAATHTEEGEKIADTLAAIAEFSRGQKLTHGDEFFNNQSWITKRKWQKVKQLAINAGYKEGHDNSLRHMILALKKKLEQITGEWLAENTTIHPIVVITEDPSGIKISYGALIKSPEFSQIVKMESGARKDSVFRSGATGEIPASFPGGSIRIYKSTQHPCLQTYIVKSTSDTTEGWGPLLYDLAMEYATLKGSGLTADRKAVSSMAKPVWDYYMSRRNDVEYKQLDIDAAEADAADLKQLTPGNTQDDCSQAAALQWAQGEKKGAWDKKGDDDWENEDPDNPEAMAYWPQESISKMFTKQDTTLKSLGRAKFLHAPSIGFSMEPPKVEKKTPKPWWKFWESVQRGT